MTNIENRPSQERFSVQELNKSYIGFVLKAVGVEEVGEDFDINKAVRDFAGSKTGMKFGEYRNLVNNGQNPMEVYSKRLEEIEESKVFEVEEKSRVTDVDSIKEGSLVAPKAPRVIRFEENGLQNGKGMGDLNIELAQVKVDMAQNMAPMAMIIQTMSLVNARYPKFYNGDPVEDFNKTLSLLSQAKDGAINLEIKDSILTAEHVKQGIMKATEKATGNFLTRAMVPIEVRNSLATLVDGAVLLQLGEMVFPGTFDANDPDQMAALEEYASFSRSLQIERATAASEIEARNSSNRALARINEAEAGKEVTIRKADSIERILKVPANVLFDENDGYLKNVMGVGKIVLEGVTEMVKDPKKSVGLMVGVSGAWSLFAYASLPVIPSAAIGLAAYGVTYWVGEKIEDKFGSSE